MTPLELAERLYGYVTWSEGWDSSVRLMPTEHGVDNHAYMEYENKETGEIFAVEITLVYEPMTYKLGPRDS